MTAPAVLVLVLVDPRHRTGPAAGPRATTQRAITGLSAALISIDDLADLEDRAALAAHLADKAVGLGGTNLADLDVALDRIDAENSA